jgi:hypothetical protein
MPLECCRGVEQQLSRRSKPIRNALSPLAHGADDSIYFLKGMVEKNPIWRAWLHSIT